MLRLFKLRQKRRKHFFAGRKILCAAAGVDGELRKIAEVAYLRCVLRQRRNCGFIAAVFGEKQALCFLLTKLAAGLEVRVRGLCLSHQVEQPTENRHGEYQNHPHQLVCALISLADNIEYREKAYQRQNDADCAGKAAAAFDKEVKKDRLRYQKQRNEYSAPKQRPKPLFI